MGKKNGAVVATEPVTEQQTNNHNNNELESSKKKNEELNNQNDTESEKKSKKKKKKKHNKSDENDTGNGVKTVSASDEPITVTGKNTKDEKYAAVKTFVGSGLPDNQQRHVEQFQNISRNDRENESDIRKNDGIFGNRTATEPVAAYPVTEHAYATTATGNAPGVGGTTTTTRYEYTAVYGTTPAPGFDGASAGGGQWGQEANTGGGVGASSGDNTGMNMNMGRDQK